MEAVPATSTSASTRWMTNAVNVNGHSAAQKPLLAGSSAETPLFVVGGGGGGGGGIVRKSLLLFEADKIY